MSKIFHDIATKIIALQIILLPIAVIADWGTDGTGFWGNVVAVNVLVSGAEVKR